MKRLVTKKTAGIILIIVIATYFISFSFFIPLQTFTVAQNRNQQALWCAELNAVDKSLKYPEDKDFHILRGEYDDFNAAIDEVKTSDNSCAVPPEYKLFF